MECLQPCYLVNQNIQKILLHCNEICHSFPPLDVIFEFLDPEVYLSQSLIKQCTDIYFVLFYKATAKSYGVSPLRI